MWVLDKRVNPGVASVSEDWNQYRGNGYGQAVITASAGDFQTQCQVTVKVSENNTPLPIPVLKLSQKSCRSNTFNLEKGSGCQRIPDVLPGQGFPSLL